MSDNLSLQWMKTNQMVLCHCNWESESYIGTSLAREAQPNN